MTSQEVVHSSMPKVFRDRYPSARVIIESIYLEPPRLLELQQITFSSYRNGYTCKYLVGVSTSGHNYICLKIVSGNSLTHSRLKKLTHTLKIKKSHSHTQDFKKLTHTLKIKKSHSHTQDLKKTHSHTLKIKKTHSHTQDFKKLTHTLEIKNLTHS